MACFFARLPSPGLMAGLGEVPSLIHAQPVVPSIAVGMVHLRMTWLQALPFSIFKAWLSSKIWKRLHCMRLRAIAVGDMMRVFC